MTERPVRAEMLRTAQPALIAVRAGGVRLTPAENTEGPKQMLRAFNV